ncbi:hypothetical protein BJV74DRAFT_210945 [Russula compacta]|nr:hypothetical protein BJV74DRAFT_210945 [Russula compacta]
MESWAFSPSPSSSPRRYICSFIRIIAALLSASATSLLDIAGSYDPFPLPWLPLLFSTIVHFWMLCSHHYLHQHHQHHCPHLPTSPCPLSRDEGCPVKSVYQEH